MAANWEDAATYGEAVRMVLAEHGSTFRQQRARTGLAHSTVAGWVNDSVPPSMKGALDFARGFGLDEKAWLRKAGFSQPETPAELLDRVVDQANELTYEPELETFDIRGYQGAENLTEGDREAINRVVRALLSEKRKQQGRE